MINYSPLFKTMKKKSVTKKDLREILKLGPPTIARFSKNEYVSLEIIDRLCDYLDCDVSDIIEYTPNIINNDSIDIEEKIKYLIKNDNFETEIINDSIIIRPKIKK